MENNIQCVYARIWLLRLLRFLVARANLKRCRIPRQQQYNNITFAACRLATWEMFMYSIILCGSVGWSFDTLFQMGLIWVLMDGSIQWLVGCITVQKLSFMEMNVCMLTMDFIVIGTLLIKIYIYICWGALNEGIGRVLSTQRFNAKHF